MTKDRRKGTERRSVKRHDVTIDIEWEGVGRREEGVLGDISEKGCFVLGSGNVANGEVVNIFVPISDGMKIQFTGEVVNHVVEIGFGMRFTGLNSAQKELLHRILEEAQK
ncbi:MAG: PilZ domain-containing protein [Acidobacteria bacterium]|nr:MAG: PilZ domain-containing protein [Acidobacteriota bacterium]REK01238.1 MAG: PilZ domain-containing protein [Acidobacteriota bacterium]REK14194.1 MAG: PilZ domain-containing protein [Acidobacteriota bacterium]REK44909.1 MAG: PilZ domain-containing protein [Acidobacteriota bacterium]